MRAKALFVAVAWSLGAAAVASAHHTIAYVDDVSKTVALTGVVTSITWKQPHVLYNLGVATPWASPVVWEIETPAPHNLHRDGIDQDTIRVGDRVTMNVYVALDGSRRAASESVVLPDGRTVRIPMKAVTPPGILPEGFVTR